MSELKEIDLRTKLSPNIRKTSKVKQVKRVNSTSCNRVLFEAYIMRVVASAIRSNILYAIKRRNKLLSIR